MSVRLINYAEEGNIEGLRECLSHLDVDFTNKKGDTALHITCQKGYKDCVRLLVAAGAALDKKNSLGQTPLHAAVLCRHNCIAILLLRSGANVNSIDDAGDRPIHIAAKEGFTELVQTICDFGCDLDKPNYFGLLPLHLASRNGHIEAVRILCLAGCDVEGTNDNGIKAEVMAFKNSHKDIGYLLNKIRIGYVREEYINQFEPIDKPIPKLNVKLLGSSGVGKTTLAQSLKAGYFTSLFSRSKSQGTGLTSGKVISYFSTNGTQIEMDTTYRQNVISGSSNYQYTRGIDLYQAAFSSGDATLWDFSGLDTFYSVYDFFIGDVCSYYVLVINSCDPPSVQYFQCSFWMTFLQVRFHCADLINKIYPRLLLVATHADVSRIHRDLQGNFVCSSVQQMKNKLAREFPDFIIDPKVIICDAHLPNSPGVKDIKYAISEKRSIICQNLQFKCTGFLTATMQHLQILRRDYEAFPVISWKDFAAVIHKNVNPLAGANHITEVVQQLILMGEIYYLKSNEDDLIILDMNWFCGEVIGGLLSLEAIARARLTGCYTEDDFQGCFPIGPADKLLALLKALQLCTQCEIDGETEYEFPCYNLVEKLDGLWAAADERYSPENSCYGGIRLKAPFFLLQIVFPRLQVKLRRVTNVCPDPDIDLYQWFRGSKLCLGDIECLITLEEDGKVIDVKVRGTHALRMSCFYFLEEVLDIIQQVLNDVFPGVNCERHVLSSEELRLHVDTPYSWPPEDILNAVLSPLNFNTILQNPKINQNETVLKLIGFGSEELTRHVVLGGELSIENIPQFCRRALALLLDPTDPLGRDWCLLAVKLGQSQKISTIDNASHFSKTLLLLEMWKKSKDAKIGNLIQKLSDMGREDAAYLLTRSAPWYKVVASNYKCLQRPVINIP